MHPRIVSSVVLLGSLLSAGCGGGGSADGPPPPPITDLYVAALTGSDANPGTQALPLKTLTAALSASAAGDTIHVAPGTYDAANGEAFPLQVSGGMTLTGARTVVYGPGAGDKVP